MRLLQFEKDNQIALGIRVGDEVVDLGTAVPELPSDMIGLIAAGTDAWEAASRASHNALAKHRISIEQIKHALPVINPDKNIGLGTNYLQHNLEMNPNFQVPEFPGMFMRVQSSMIAHNQPMIRPVISDTLDYEGELAFVIGRKGRHIPAENAHDYVFGYCCHNDGSVREFNRIHLAITAGKNFAGTGALGPEIVTADELPAGANGLRLQTRVNGELRQNESTASMHWNVAQLVHLMSRMMELRPGDIITTGTPSGVGAGFNPPRFLKPGDRVEVEIEGIGILSNAVEEERI